MKILAFVLWLLNEPGYKGYFIGAARDGIADRVRLTWRAYSAPKQWRDEYMMWRGVIHRRSLSFAPKVVIPGKPHFSKPGAIQ